MFNNKTLQSFLFYVAVTTGAAGTSSSLLRGSSSIGDDNIDAYDMLTPFLPTVQSSNVLATFSLLIL